MTIEPVLSVEGLNVWFDGDVSPAHVVRDVSFEVRPGEILAIVGESGCGKSVTAMTLLGLTRSRNARFSGTVRFGEHELLSLSEPELRAVRGAGISMVFQDPLTSLNPVMTVGAQIEEMLRLHLPISRSTARRRAVEMLETVGIADADRRARQFPHEFSGGMRQRAMIAMAMSCNPPVLIADEPTTALDVTIQAQILELITSLAHDRGSAVILITHDLGVVAETADVVAVMYAGEIVELATRDDLFSAPQHPYTWGLLASIPRVDQPRTDRLPSIEGQPPSPSAVLSGCGFRDRCAFAFEACAAHPLLEERSSNRHLDRCQLPVSGREEQRRAIYP